MNKVLLQKKLLVTFCENVTVEIFLATLMIINF